MAFLVLSYRYLGLPQLVFGIFDNDLQKKGTSLVLMLKLLEVIDADLFESFVDLIRFLFREFPPSGSGVLLCLISVLGSRNRNDFELSYEPV